MSDRPAPFPATGSRSEAIPWPTALTGHYVLALAMVAAILYAPGTPVAAGQYALVVGMLAFNGLLSQFWEQLRTPDRFATVLVLDILLVSLVIGLTDRGSTDLYLFYFVIVLASAVTQRLDAFILVTTVICLAYGAVLHVEMGPAALRESALLFRVPFLFAVAVFLGVVVDRFRSEQFLADQLASSLAEISRLGTSSRSTGQVLQAFAAEIQRALEVDRCSIILTSDDLRVGYLAASGDDPSVQEQSLVLDRYPEIQTALDRGRPVEISSGRPPDLWTRVSNSLPPGSAFRSFLIVPVFLRQELVGVLFLRCSRDGRAFTQQERAFCEAVALLTATFIRERDLEHALGRPAPEGYRASVCSSGGRRPAANPKTTGRGRWAA